MHHLTISQELTLLPADNQRLSNFCGQFNIHLQQIEQCVNVEIANRGNQFKVSGFTHSVEIACSIIKALFNATQEKHITDKDVYLLIQNHNIELPSTSVANTNQNADYTAPVVIKTKQGNIKGRNTNQQTYLQRIMQHNINFGVGPAGTGKTYLAVACAVEALQSEKISRIILVRPAVEAGEKLGFLPGDIAQKVDPYLRPLYDALYEMLGFEKVEKLIKRHIIEVAPLAFMRGRTLNDAFIILDEAQNTTTEQIKMFLTRVGFGSVVVVTGDVTQIDLPNAKVSGLKHVLQVLKAVDGVSFTFFSAKDVVRHPLVRRIVDAYERYDNKHNQ